ncbi:MAG: hypothetical protein LUD27_08760, partial [Clostridia bacterium]|nr:hypothetical protein [Clostridia bacterium]
SGVSEVLLKAYQAVLSLPLDVALYIVWGIYAAIFLLALIVSRCSFDARRADKRPFLSFTNAFTAVTLALTLTEEDLSLSILTAVAFWCVGYILYGVLVLASRRQAEQRQIPSAAVAATSSPPESFTPSAPPAKGNVRLEHAISVTDKLLLKELGRGDRQEAERIRANLSLLQLKAELTPDENQRLNDNFNTLLKLMAKYNL